MPAERELIPVLVDAAGRSGTTAMMQLLASSPAVATEREYPYESRYLTYLYSWTRLLDGDPEAAAGWPRGEMLPGPVSQIGGLPWRGLLPDASRFADGCFRAAWRHFSEGVEAGATHYIEKVPRWVGEGVPRVLPATWVIHLVRDPRDVWLSSAAFNAKRGFPAFGREEGQAEEDYFDEFVSRQRRRLEPLAGREFAGRETLVRYEDLVSDTAAATGRLAEWLGLDLDPSAFADRNRDHVTTACADSSMGRWRRELARPLRRRFEREMGDLLTAFGYR